MTKWTHDHPIGTHLINMGITVLIVGIGFFLLKYLYGDLIIDIHYKVNALYNEFILK